MNNSISSRISIYLSVDQKTMEEYFNNHDPAPIYKRQLSHGFDQYITSSIKTIKRYTVLTYKIGYKCEADKEYIDPLMYAIRRHFSERKLLKQAEFEKFKRRSYFLLVMSLAVVMVCQGVLPYVLNFEHRIHSAISNSLDVFSWVILWRPIDNLIFDWNPYLKEISIMDRLAGADVVLINHEE